MARTDNLTNFLTDVADSIRSKTGKSDAIACEDFDTEIESISGGGSQKNRLPDAYQEVEYIESSGTQYFNTDYYANGNSQFEFNITYKTNSGVPFGAYDSGWTTGYGYYHNSASNSYEYVHYHSNSYVNYMGGTNSTQKIVIDKGNVYINDSFVHSHALKTFTVNYPIYILAGNWAGTRAEQPISARLYYFKIKENDITVHNYIPCYRKSDEVIGMYDLVEEEFITNAGTGTFTKGEDHDTPFANLQNKTITITENTTTEITAGAGYDGLYKVTIITNIN